MGDQHPGSVSRQTESPFFSNNGAALTKKRMGGPGRTRFGIRRLQTGSILSRGRSHVTDPLEFFRRKKPGQDIRTSSSTIISSPIWRKCHKLLRPILVVDCFAGPGRFDDGAPGKSADHFKPIKDHSMPTGPRSLLSMWKKPRLCSSPSICNTQDCGIPVQVRPRRFSAAHTRDFTTLRETTPSFCIWIQ